MWILSSMIACSAPGPAEVLVAPQVAPQPPADPRHALRERYPDVLARIASEQIRLRGALASGAPRQAVHDEARALLLATFRDEILPAWSGTPWDFYGTSDTPGQGAIACGHFLGTVIEDLGFRVDRLALGRQASEHIIETFAPDPQIVRAWGATSEDFVRRIASRGEGVYLLGLDQHAASLDVRGDQVWMCHASYLEPVAVVCEEAIEAPALVSRYRVAGPLLNDASLERWLSGAVIEVVTR